MHKQWPLPNELLVRDMLWHHIAMMLELMFVQVALQQSGIPYTCVYTSSFYENFSNLFQYRKQEDGSYLLSLPVDESWNGPLHSADATGAAVARVFSLVCLNCSNHKISILLI